MKRKKTRQNTVTPDPFTPEQIEVLERTAQTVAGAVAALKSITTGVGDGILISLIAGRLLADAYPHFGSFSFYLQSSETIFRHMKALRDQLGGPVPPGTNN